MNPAEELLYRLSRTLVQKRDRHIVERDQASGETPPETTGQTDEQGDSRQEIAGARSATFDRSEYKDWRNSELRSQFDDNFQPDSVTGKRVLDFGCGSGKLSLYVASLGAGSVDGIDLNEDSIQYAQTEAEKSGLSPRPRFQVGKAESIPFPDASFDVILCFDVLEHVMNLEEIMQEWQRVLAPGGRILIWWQPYYHPYGHHLMAYIPLPWVHVFFSNKTMAAVCGRIKMAPEYAPRFWDLDEEGNRIPWTSPPEVLGGVNGLTIGAFEKICESNGFRFARKEGHQFSGPSLVQSISRSLSSMPVLKEYFTAYAIYEIERA